jgi:nucleotide-binding universal stress UspA family protein
MKANRVLIPLDESDFSLNVLPQVTRLFSPMLSDLVLLHVAPEPREVTVDERVVIFADQAAESAKANALVNLLPCVRGLEELGYRVTPMVTFGNPASEIERTAKAKDVDIIAMATHARAGLDRWLHGSVAQEVVNTVDVPVLLYHAEEEDERVI